MIVKDASFMSFAVSLSMKKMFSKEAKTSEVVFSVGSHPNTFTCRDLHGTTLSHTTSLRQAYDMT